MNLKWGLRLAGREPQVVSSRVHCGLKNFCSDVFQLTSKNVQNCKISNNSGKFKGSNHLKIFQNKKKWDLKKVKNWGI
jgi:hypothetical protein